MKYDIAYQEWLYAKSAKDYLKADNIRTDFERNHGLTIFAEGKMPTIGITTRKMKDADWEMQHGNPGVAKILREWDSRIK